ncbi:MAG: hypothetical protein ACRDTC_23955 [Pseudonocardiaceae bacterium]
MDLGVTMGTSSPEPWRFPPSVADIERITALPDPVVRNLRITQCYHELSLAIGARTGNHANWCTFAVWASKQAGQTIRKEDLARTFERLWATSADISSAAALTDLADHRRRIREAVLASSSFERASEATARGNRKVFEEIAREFARFLAAFEKDTVFDAERISTFCAEFKPGDPPDGQRYLIQAFTNYYQALFENDPKSRGEFLLLANIAVGLHEQTRLQPDITDALNAPVIDPRELSRRLREILLPGLGWLSRLWWRLMSWIGLRDTVELACSRLLEQARLLGRVAITEHLLTLGLPHGRRLQLGMDIRAEFPEALAKLVNTELLALLALVDPTPDSVAETSARDWSILPERLHFIADMFRCFQEQSDLLAPPFTTEQAMVIKNGRTPQGRL